MNGVDQFDLEIAIVGMAGRFPGAGSVEALWRLLRAGAEGIRDLSDDELKAAGVADAMRADPRFVRRAADIEGADLFDAELFGFTPREAELTDPQFRILLEDAWSALEDAGRLSDKHDLRVGVFAGASGNTYFQHNIASNRAAAEAVGSFQTALGNVRDYLASQISYRLDLRGPSLVVQTACSTSLVAVHVACQSLLQRECDVALAGGVSVSVPQTTGYLYEDGGIESPDGRCRAFSASAAGCVKGNGSGIVVLRRMSDALRDGDRIRAVIKGSAVNNDGRVKVGFTAPGEEGQAGVIAEALAAADVDPSTITYVEAHGTGTSLGDPVEVAALGRAFDPGGNEKGPPCALGSIKSNLGHLDAAAGVAGLIKTVLALEHGEIPPTLHCDAPNPRIDFDRTRFRPATQLRPWTTDGIPRRAGVSSFGIGGTNAHVVLEEAPRPSDTGERPRREHLIVLSAASEAALDAASEALAGKLSRMELPDLADAAYTLQVGRKRLYWRRALTASDAEEAAAALRGKSRDTAPRRDDRRNSEVAFLFPGQGSQHIGMGRGPYSDEPAFAGALDRCAEILRPVMDLDLRDVLYPEGPAGDADARLRETSVAQPALFAVEYALARLWISWGVRPAAMAGHSIGEYVAACLAEVMSLEDALHLVAERGRLMGRMPAGTMLAVRLDETRLRDRCAARPGLSVAAVNGPSSCVASGPSREIARLEAELSGDGVACRRLSTSHAFHSAMMDPVLPEFESLVRSARLRPPSIPFLSNESGTWITSEQATDPGYWARHLRRPVRFADNVSALASDPSRVLLEVGPGTVLSSLARQIAPELSIVPSLPRVRDTAEETSMTRALGALWCAGVDVDWEAYHEGTGRRRVPLPTYPFQRRRHWIEPGKPVTGEIERPLPSTSDAPAKDPDLADWFYLPGWRRSASSPLPSGGGAPWLLFDDGSDLARAVAEHAAAGGARVVIVRAGTNYSRENEETFTIDPRRPEHYDDLLRALRSDDLLPRRIAHLWCADARLDPEAVQDLGLFSLLFLARAIGQTVGDLAGLRMAVVAADLFDVAGERVACPERATLVGPCRVMPQEYAGIACCLIDPGSGDTLRAARDVISELDSDARDALVARRGGYRWVPSYTRSRLEAPAGGFSPFDRGGAFLLTGGTGPLELALAARLADTGAGGIAFLDCGDESPVEIERLRSAGIDVQCHRERVTEPGVAAATVRRLRDRFGRLDAVFHTAGAIGGGMIQLKERPAVEAVLAPRLDSARALAEQLKEDELLVLFSSAISATGVFGQVDYCAAAAFLDAFAQKHRSGPGPRVLAVDWATALWDRWQESPGGGASALIDQLRSMQQAIGITVEEGVEALWRALQLDEPQLLVSPQDLDEVIEQAASASVTQFLETVEPGAAPAVGRDGREPADLATETERRVADIWSSLLGITPIGRTDSFFDLGGNSLLAIQLASHLRRGFDIDLTIATLFESEDLASLAAAVDRALGERRGAAEVARLLDEIEALSEDEIRAELEKTGTQDSGVSVPARAIEVPVPPRGPDPSGSPSAARRDPEAWRRDRPASPMRFSIYLFSDDGSTASRDKYRLALESARFADANGFDAIWTPERHFQSFGGLYPNPSVLGAAIAAVTRRVGIRAGSVALPLHNPVRVAEEWSVVDNLSGGRVAVSFASGWHPDDFVLFPTPYARRKEAMYGGIETIRKLWAGGTVVLEGPEGREVTVRTLPRPVQKELPVWVTTAGSVETWERAGSIGANVLAALVGYSPDDLTDAIRRYRRARSAAGHDPAAGRVTLVAHTYVGMDDDAVREQVRETMTSYLETYLGQFRKVAIDSTQDSDRDARDIAALAFDHYFDSSTLLGSQLKCARVVEKLAGCGADEVACLIDFGLEVEAVLEALPRLAELRAHYAGEGTIENDSVEAAVMGSVPDGQRQD